MWRQLSAQATESFEFHIQTNWLEHAEHMSSMTDHKWSEHPSNRTVQQE